ncbi:TetR family transcriptional regulator [Saccharopolyspora indica]|uniref:TetR family transcriptional regulator n=1 Tax=Saccharopolyspora indica TaxID=1229659 RepID=UPI0022EAB989|nr:TetR family transcriptional regulator [Saccharopolyspora indica]MDA3649660.1 TetR family transcriptional regulator [Saccharopolyspora indica]
MPRIAEARPPAEPSSQEQKARQRRILRAAASLATERGLDRVQMQDVAKEAGVAIATLYRYFPSKTHLFTAVMAEQVEQLDGLARPPRPGQDPVEAVCDLLLRSSRKLLSRPLLASAMMQSNVQANAATVNEAIRIDKLMQDAVLRMLGIESPTARDIRLVSLVIECWYGMLSSALNGRLSMADVEEEIRLACGLLLAARSNA